MSATGKVIKLSVNSDVVKTKDEGKTKKEFKVESFDLDNQLDRDWLKTVLHTNVHSVNAWKDGSRLGANYEGLFGIALDYDDGSLSLEDAKNQFSKYINIIHTTSSHKNNDEGNIEKFRVILPFNITNGTQIYPDYQDVTRVYEYMKEKFPESDPSVQEPARIFFPFTGTDPNLYECFINTDGGWFEIPEYALKTVALNKKKISTNDRFSLDNKVLLAKGSRYNGKEWVGKEKKIGDIIEHTPIFCPFCEDRKQSAAHGASAFVDINQNGVYYIFCSHCMKVTGNGTYWVDDKDRIEAIGICAFQNVGDGNDYYVRYPNGYFAKCKDVCQIARIFRGYGLPCPSIMGCFRTAWIFDNEDLMIDGVSFPKE